MAVGFSVKRRVAREELGRDKITAAAGERGVMREREGVQTFV